MGVFLWIFFKLFFKESHCILAFVFAVLLSSEGRTYFDCCACLVGSWPSLFAWGYGCSLHVSELSPPALKGWFIGDSARGQLYQQNLKAVMALGLVQCPQLFSKQPDLSCAPIAGCLTLPATGEWFQHSDPCSSGTGL